MKSIPSFIKSFILLGVMLVALSCASSYKVPEPQNINFISFTSNDSLKLYYKYDLLETKYAKKELKNDYKVIAVKIINNSHKDYIFGEDLTLEYSNGRDVYILDPEIAYKSLKQGAAIYSLYLLMTPLNLYTYRTDSNGFQKETSSTPIGLILGPGLALTNIIGASSANKKFKTHLNEHNLVGEKIGKGETVFGFIPIKSTSFDALQLRIVNDSGS